MQRDAPGRWVLVHEQRARFTRLAGQQAPAHQAKTLAFQQRRLQRRAQAARQPLDQVRLLLRTDLDRMAFFGHIHRMRHARFLHEAGFASAGQRRVDRAQPPAAREAQAEHQAGHQALQPGPRAARPGGARQRQRHGLVEHTALQRLQAQALGLPGLDPGGGVGVLQQPVRHHRDELGEQLAVHPGVQLGVGHGSGVVGGHAQGVFISRSSAGVSGSEPGRHRPSGGAAVRVRATAATSPCPPARPAPGPLLRRAVLPHTPATPPRAARG